MDKLRVMEDKQDIVEEPVPVAPPIPFIHLEADGKGGWRLSSNIPNPERILRIIGAQLTLRNEQ